MTDISERFVVHHMESDAAHALAAFVSQHRAGDGSVRLALRLPVPIVAAWKSAIERRGVADFASLRSSGDRFPTYSVTWSSRGGGPFPIFAGALAVEPLSSSDSFGLILSGNYVPPLGGLGVLFDAVLGRRIAHATAHDLLTVITAFIEGLPLDDPLPAALGVAGAATTQITF